MRHRGCRGIAVVVLAISAASGCSLTSDGADSSVGQVREPSDFDPLRFDWAAVGAPPSGRENPLDAPRRLVQSREVLEWATSSTRDPVVTVTGDAVDAGVRGCRLSSPVVAQGAGSRALAERCTFRTPGAALRGSAITARFNDISTQGDGINPTGGARGLPTTIEYNRIHRDGSRRGTAHHDGIQFWQGGNALIRRNWISGFVNAAIMIKAEREARPGDGPVSRVVIRENYLANPDGYYILYVRPASTGRPTYITVTDNVLGEGRPISTGSTPDDIAVFVRTEGERDEAVRDGVEGAAAWIVWSGNRDRQGREVEPPGGWRRYP